MEQLSEKSEYYFSTVIEAMTDLVRVLDMDGNVIFANRAMKERFRQPEGCVCYTQWGQRHPCEHCLRAEAMKGDVVNGERTVQGRSYSVKAAPVYGENGEITAVVEVFRDITETAAIRDRIMKINTRMVRELEMARSLQRAMMPAGFAQIGSFTFHAGFFPCEAVGGDAYDCVELGGGRVLIYVADVSGHGVRAAMLTVFLQQAIRSMAKREQAVGVGEILHGLHRAFLELRMDDSVYITAFLAIIDTKTGRMEYTNAGHSVSPLMKRRCGVRELFLPGVPISRWIEAPSWAVKTCAFEEGDRLALFTDGITNAFAPQDSERELQEAFHEEPFHAKAFIQRAREIQEPNYTDDFAMIVCQRAQHTGEAYGRAL